MAGPLVLLATTHRVAPGLLSWQAWQVLRSARVLVGSADHPQLPYLAEAGVYPEVAGAGPDHERARALVAACGEGGTVAWLAGPDGDEGLLRALGELATGMAEAPEIELVHGSYDLPGARLLDVVTTMDRLRVDCPWDAKQTHSSLAPHLIEEAYEAVEAVETGDLAALREELGDVLLQVAFHARVADERVDETGFTVDDVAAGIVDKLVRRHPHVFGDVEVGGADEVKANWDAIKAAERAQQARKNGGDGAGADVSILDGVPFGQPALALAHALQRRAARAGVPAELLTGAGTGAGTDAGTAGLGDELFALVARAREQGADAEAALRQAAREFRDRLRAVEETARDEDHEPRELSPEDWRRHWRGE